MALIRRPIPVLFTTQDKVDQHKDRFHQALDASNGEVVMMKSIEPADRADQMQLDTMYPDGVPNNVSGLLVFCDYVPKFLEHFPTESEGVPNLYRIKDLKFVEAIAPGKIRYNSVEFELKSFSRIAS